MRNQQNRKEITDLQWKTRTSSRKAMISDENPQNLEEFKQTNTTREEVDLSGNHVNKQINKEIKTDRKKEIQKDINK